MPATHDSNGERKTDVALKSVLEKGGVEFGHSMRGKRLASCLLVEAADGYSAVIALPEIDPDSTDKQIVAAKFQKQTGKEVKQIYGSSGNFFQQLQNGAPFDMFF